MRHEDSSSPESLPRRRILGRMERFVPPIIWEITAESASDAGPEIYALLQSHAMTWLIVPQGLDEDVLRRLGEIIDQDKGWSLIMGVGAEALRRRSGLFESRLTALGRRRCTAAILEGISPAEAKAGSPFHRLSQWRDKGLIELFMAGANDCAGAEWMVEHSPAHAVSLPFGIADQLAKYRLLASAGEIGTGLLAHRMTATADPRDIRFRAGEEGVAALVEPLVSDLEELRTVIEAAAHPMPAVERAELWEEFQSRVGPPAKAVSAHPPE